jgi:hypothetical protein
MDGGANDDIQIEQDMTPTTAQGSFTRASDAGPRSKFVNQVM